MDLGYNIKKNDGYYPACRKFEDAELRMLIDSVLFYLGSMGSFIRKGTCAGKKYTRILIPSLIFIVFTYIFFIIISLLQGGLFRGWLKEKKNGNTVIPSSY